MPVLKNIFEYIVSRYGLKLDDIWNKEYLPYLGSHPNEYHVLFVLQARCNRLRLKQEVTKFYL